MKDKIANSTQSLPTGQDFSIGNDLVFIPEFKAGFNELFKSRVYTSQEIAYCDRFNDSIVRYASTWAAKEAVYKAVKQVVKIKLPLIKIEITRDKIAGRPNVKIATPYEHNLAVSLTISHDGDYAWAIALVKTGD